MLLRLGQYQASISHPWTAICNLALPTDYLTIPRYLLFARPGHADLESRCVLRVVVRGESEMV